MELPLEAVKASVYIAFLYKNYCYVENSVSKFIDVTTELNHEWTRFVDEVGAEFSIGGDEDE